MATKYATVEVWVVVDEAGNHECGPDADAARTRFEESVAALNECEGTRLVKLTVKVPLPTVIELTGEVECEESGSELKVA